MRLDHGTRSATYVGVTRASREHTLATVCALSLVAGVVAYAVGLACSLAATPSAPVLAGQIDVGPDTATLITAQTDSVGTITLIFSEGRVITVDLSAYDNLVVAD